MYTHCTSYDSQNVLQLNVLTLTHCLQVTVSSGGMLVTKLDPIDLQFERVRRFDGTFAYAQNKVSQCVENASLYSQTTRMCTYMYHHCEMYLRFCHVHMLL